MNVKYINSNTRLHANNVSSKQVQYVQNVNTIKQYSRAPTAPSRNHCQNDHGNHTNPHVGYDHDHDK